jgi:hypothetical protein
MLASHRHVPPGGIVLGAMTSGTLVVVAGGGGALFVSCRDMQADLAGRQVSDFTCSN